MSLGMIVTRLACMAHKFVSSKSPTKYASAASWRAANAWAVILASDLKSCTISLIRRQKGAFLISNSVLFWYLLISRSATVPGLNLWGFFPISLSLLLLASLAFFAAAKDCTFPPPSPDCALLAVCLVLAISPFWWFSLENSQKELVTRRLAQYS